MCRSLSFCCLGTIKGILVRLLSAIHAMVLCMHIFEGYIFENKYLHLIPGDMSDSDKFEHLSKVPVVYLAVATIECLITSVVKRGKEWKW